jgi:hypothetical protein
MVVVVILVVFDDDGGCGYDSGDGHDGADGSCSGGYFVGDSSCGDMVVLVVAIL